MAQANVFTQVASVAWATDKCRITTSNTVVTYQVNIVYPTASGNLFSVPAAIPADSSIDVYVGTGNELTITGDNFTAQEIGTSSSGSAGVL